MFRRCTLIGLLTTTVLTVGFVPQAAATGKFTVAWSIHASWMPWDYAGNSGILKRWADRYGIEIEFVRMDYLSSIDAYAAQQVDAALMTNVDFLSMLGAAGIDSTALIVGGYSNGSDALMTRDDLDVKGLAGKSVSLVEHSVSHYLLSRALAMNGLSLRDVGVQNMSDADFGPIFLADSMQKAVVTWNPIVMEVEQAPGIRKAFSSAEIPGEIIDMMVVRTDVLSRSPALGSALTGAWYEVMGLLSKGGPAAQDALAAMAKATEASVEQFQTQLATTAMYSTPQSAIELVESGWLQQTMNFVREFMVSQGLFDTRAGATFGVAYPDGTVQGVKGNVTLRFDTRYMRAAAAGTL